MPKRADRTPQGASRRGARGSESQERDGRDTTVSEAVEGLYAAFRTYPLRPVVDFCPHCITAAEEEGLHEAPLRHLDNRAFRRFAWKAVSTWGTVNDFKHFLPRMLELAASDRDFWPDVDELFHKLDRLGWRAWPEAERVALEQFAEACRRACVDGSSVCLDQ